MINTILFDLDGTLLSFDQDEFIRLYFAGIVEKFSPHGYDNKVIMNALYEGVKSMLENDGKKTNEEVFWDRFTYFLPENIYFFENTFLDYYKNEYNEIEKIVVENIEGLQAVELLKSKGYEIVLATNPLFPLIATGSRIKWGKYNIDDFKLVTTFENSSFCKPNLLYYEEILKKIKKKPSECLMVGNDISDDMVVETLGMDTYLITDNLINKDNVDINKFKHGRYTDFYTYVKNLKDLK